LPIRGRVAAGTGRRERKLMTGYINAHRALSGKADFLTKFALWLPKLLIVKNLAEGIVSSFIFAPQVGMRAMRIPAFYLKRVGLSKFFQIWTGLASGACTVQF